MALVVVLRRRDFFEETCEAIKERSKHDIRVIVTGGNPPAGATHLVRWGCISQAGMLPPVKTLNKADSIRKVSDKAAFRRLLFTKALCPKTWAKPDQVELPAIVRPSLHAECKDFHVVRDQAALDRAIKLCGLGWYASEIIDKAHEYRVYAFQGRCTGVDEKFPRNRSRVDWGMAQNFTNVRWGSWPLKAVEASLKAADLSGLDFGGVDVITDKAGNAYVLEVNSAPSVEESDYRLGTFVKALDWSIDGNVTPKRANAPGWRSYIHPAVVEGGI